MLTNSIFLWMMDIVDTGRFTNYSCHSPNTSRVSLDVIRKQVVGLFHLVNTGWFLLLSLESEKCNTSCYPITPRLLPLPLETGMSNTSSQVGKQENTNRVLRIGQRVRNPNWKSVTENRKGECQHCSQWKIRLIAFKGTVQQNLRWV
jgi:hypothetical protein